MLLKIQPANTKFPAVKKENTRIKKGYKGKKTMFESFSGPLKEYPFLAMSKYQNESQWA
jgi:hypothetical protein